MSFTSLTFILALLPAAYIGFVLAEKFFGDKGSQGYLAFISLALYGLWGFKLLAILMASLCFNFLVGQRIAALREERGAAKSLLTLAISANLLVLGYLKYSNFFIDSANQALGLELAHFVDSVAPIGLSYYTFVQLGYLIDAYNGQLIGHNFTRYIIFAAFFPSVTAGPLVMQREMMEQLAAPGRRALDLRRVVIGMVLFAMGLFKKVVMADSIAPFADAVFNGTETGMAVDWASAWIGSLSYMLQLYFDFSGYSDMAIGLGTVFGIKLPLNFDSPFKATNISDFWRRWHMTMTRFFTAYIYSGLAMDGMRKAMRSRAGRFGRYFLAAAVPSFFTFLCAGIWHGAGLTFVVYGAMHGAAIAVFLGWREYSKVPLAPPIAWGLTMLTVVSGLVLFRSGDMTTAATLLRHMYGLGTVDIGAKPISLDVAQALSMIVIFSAVTLLLPNSQQILHHDWPVVDSKPADAALNAGLVSWRPNFGTAVITAAIFVIGLASISSTTGFVYYKF